MKTPKKPTHLSGYAKDAKGKSGITRIKNAIGFSRDGLVAAYQNEQAFRQVVYLNALLLFALCFVPFALVVKMVLVLASMLSLIVELFNTGLEAAIDHTSTAKHPLAKIGKDVGSAAQLVMLGCIAVLWLMACFG